MDTKDKNGKTRHCCTKHKMWTLHKASECKMEVLKKTTPTKRKKKGFINRNKPYRLQIMKKNQSNISAVFGLEKYWQSMLAG